MAALSPILLSSSPSHSIILITPPKRSTIASMSSSPSLPSPTQLFGKKSSYFTHDNSAIPVSKAPLTGFTSASQLLREVEALEQGSNGLIETRKELGEKKELENRDKKPAVSKKRREKANSSVRKAKAPRKTPAKSEGRTSTIDNEPTAYKESETLDVQTSEKKKPKKNKGEAQTKIGNNKIVKPGATKKSKAVAGSRKSKGQNQSIAKAPPTNGETNYAPGEEPLDLELVEAIRRRRDWTPAKDTPQVLPPVEKAGLVEEADISSHAPLTLETSVLKEIPLSGFENLLGDYAYARNEDSLSNPNKTRDLTGQALTKRRKVELVNLAFHTPFPMPQSKKLKAPKKKPQTITEKATAPFMPAGPATPSLLEYFETPRFEAEIIIQSETHSGLMPNPKSVRKKKNTMKSVTTKNQKKLALAPVVLSPVTAVKSTKNQELIFGTSSQLAREESPTLIREVQQAIAESELIGEQSTPIPTNSLVSSSNWITLGSSGITPVTSSRNLWSLAARDGEGCLLNAEVVDLVDTLKPSTIATHKSGPTMPKLDESRVVGEPPNDWKTIEKLSGPSLEIELGQNSPIQQDDMFVEKAIPKSLAEASLRQRPRSRSPVKKSKVPIAINTPNLALGQMPNYKGFTTAELSKEITTYGFKAIKKRNDMIALLERCWESQSRIALQALEPPVNLPEPPANKAKSEASPPISPKKKGRPRKVSTATVTGEEASAKTPPPKKARGRPRKEAPPASSPKKSAPTSQTLPSAPHMPITHPQPTHPPSPTTFPLPILPPLAPTTLLSQITRAITTFPPTHQPSNLTFGEKILLYEPVVVEDLTAWLNTEGLGKVGIDDEVGGALVKEWCDGKGVCCFWRGEGWRSKRG